MARSKIAVMLPYKLIIVLLMFLPGLSWAKSIKVYPGRNSFQKAINAAKRNDTLLLQPGVYKEHDILINKKLVVIGVHYPVIDGEHTSQIIFITADSVILQGLQVQNTGRSSMTDMAAIRVQNANHVIVRNNKAFNNTYGIYLQNAGFTVVQNNIIQANSEDELNSGNGIHAWKCHDLIITGNDVSGHRDGIYFEFVTTSAITGNVSHANVRYGLHFMFSHNDTYTNNRFSDNGSGVAVMYSKGVTMTGNIFLHNWGDAAYGILLKEIADSKINHNQFLKNTVGLYMESTTNIAVGDNQFNENGWGIKVMASCSGSNFTRNNFTGNSFDVATNGTTMLNHFSENFWDKYDGYDLDKNGTGDVPYYPVSVYSVVSERVPTAMILYRSFLTGIMEQVEKVMPSIIPDQLKDDTPRMKKWKL
ncbi:nitrous oxide reductase family maturation protein NosD [Chitinophaga ginsengisoli]|nr:nitrous oxide reductase family maturation protein NosD [Chitinophaga ginsengisoli]